MLKNKLILEDDFEWSLPSMRSNSDQSNTRGKLQYIGGVDISFLKEDPSMACAAVVVLDADTLEVVHEEFDVVQLQVPYIPGFLAFREVLHTASPLFWRICFEPKIFLMDLQTTVVYEFIHAFLVICTSGTSTFSFSFTVISKDSWTTIISVNNLCLLYIYLIYSSNIYLYYVLDSSCSNTQNRLVRL